MTAPLLSTALYLTVHCAGTTLNEDVDEIFAAYAEAGSPGCAVSVIEAGEVIYSNGYGEAQLEFGAPITADTAFHVASISKQFTAFAVCLLEQDGVLSLDDPVRRWVRSVPDLGKTITLRHLMHHTSGLRDQWELLILAGWRMDDVITHADVLGLVARQQALNFEPGERWMYCNTGYTLLAEVVRNAAGMSLREYTEEAIFGPLGMSQTHFHDDHEHLVPGRAYSYRIDGTGYRKQVLSYAVAGATSLFTTVEDLAPWIENLELGEVGADGALEVLMKPGALNSGRELPYAGGLNHGHHRGLPTVSHGGADAGFRSFLVWFPEQELAVAVLGNMASLNASRLAYQVAEVYLGEEMEPVERRTRPAGAGLATQFVKPDPESPWAGHHVNQFHDRVYEVTERAGALYVTFGTANFGLEQVEGDHYKVQPPAPFDAVHFQRDAEGKISGTRIIRPGDEPDVTRLVPAAPSFFPPDYAGRFYSEELGAVYEFVAARGQLTLKRSHHDNVNLEAVYQDGFKVGDLAHLCFTRDADGAIDGFVISTGRVKNLRFDRFVPPAKDSGS